MPKWEKICEGVRVRLHETRTHNRQPDRYFVIRYRIDGKYKQEALGWASEGWTVTKAKEMLHKVLSAKVTGEEAVTLGEKRAQAQAAREAIRNKPTILYLWECYASLLEGRSSAASDTCNMRYLLERFADKTPDDIRTYHVDTLISDLIAAGKAPQTVKHIISLLRRIIRYGARSGLCVMPDISQLHFNMPKVDNQKTECLTPEQAQALFAALDADPDQSLAAMMRLALATGMRRGALLGLKWEDLDFRTGHITLRGDTAKSGKTTQIPMSSGARAILCSVKRTESPYVFPGKDGGRRVEVRRFTNRIRQKANLPKDFRPFHGLRHTFASWLASSGEVDLFMLQELLTHGSPQMTQRYAHLADDAKKRAASVMDRLMDEAANAAPTTNTAPKLATRTPFPRG